MNCSICSRLSGRNGPGDASSTIAVAPPARQIAERAQKDPGFAENPRCHFRSAGEAAGNAATGRLNL